MVVRFWIISVVLALVGLRHLEATLARAAADQPFPAPGLAHLCGAARPGAVP